MEEKNEFPKLGDKLDELRQSLKDGDMKKTLNIFKLIKINSYSLSIKPKSKLDKEAYNEIKLEKKIDNI